MSRSPTLSTVSDACAVRYRNAAATLTIAVAMLAALPAPALAQHDDDVTISFGNASASVHEGDPLGISVHFSEPAGTVVPDGEYFVTIYFTRTEKGGARYQSDYWSAGSAKVHNFVDDHYVGFAFRARADNVVDPGESVVIEFDETRLPDGLVVGEPSTIEVTILDGPSTPAASKKVTLSVDPTSVSEDAGGTTVTVTGTLNGATRGENTGVTVSVGSDSATAGTDFDTVTDFTLTIPANETSGTATFSLTPTDDNLVEGAETLTVSGSTNDLTVDSTTLTINDNDTASTKVTLSVSPDEVSEGAAATTVTVTGTLDEAARTSDTSVTVSVGSDSATAGTDFDTVTDFTLTIAAKETSGTATFSLTPTDDGVAEGSETVTVSGTAGDLSVDSATVTITDDDATPTKVILSVNPATVNEDDPSTQIRVTGTLDGAALTTATEVTVSVGAGTDNAAEGTDYTTVNNFTLTIDANAMEGSTTFDLVPTDDEVAEGAETVTVSGITSDLSVDPATVTITDDDATPTKVILSVNPATVNEDDTSTQVRVTGTLDGAALTTATEVTVSVGAGTDSAAEGTDYTTVNNFTLTIDANAMEGSATFDLVPTDDAVAEGAETVTVSGTTSDLSVDPATVTITDDDATPTSVILSVNPATVNEDDTSTEIRVTGTLDGAALTTATEVTGSVGAGTDSAAEGTDYTTVNNFTLTIDANAMEGSTTFDLVPTDDEVAEGAETVTVSGITSDLTVDPATVTIIDDDATPTSVILSVNPATVNEDDTSTEIRVTGTLDGAALTTATEVTVSVGAGTDSAAEGTDYTTVNNFTLTIDANAMKGSTTFDLVPTDDEVAEGAETVTVSGTTSDLSVDPATVTIIDNDAPAAQQRVKLSMSGDSEWIMEDAGPTRAGAAGAVGRGGARRSRGWTGSAGAVDGDGARRGRRRAGRAASLHDDQSARRTPRDRTAHAGAGGRGARRTR